MSLLPEDDLAAAEASAVDVDGLAPAEVPEPFGRTPLFDFEEGRMVRAGGEPVWVSGIEAVAQWCAMAARSARYAHRVFSAEFGMEDPDSVIGEAADVEELVGDWGERLAEALVVHDRISSVENFAAHYDAASGIMYIDTLDVVTDEESRLSLGPLSVLVGAEDLHG